MAMLTVFFALLSVGLAAELHCTGSCRGRDPNATMNKAMHIKQGEWATMEMLGFLPHRFPVTQQKAGATKCVDGKAGEYPCRGVDMLSFMSLAQLGNHRSASDVWGYTDEATGTEIAIACMWDAVVFLDVTGGEQRHLATMKAAGKGSSWCDIKVYRHYAYVVKDSSPGHGIQVFDLNRLKGMSRSSKAVDVEPDYHYTEHGSSHNLIINEETGFLYSVGTDTCRSGLHMIDLVDPAKPRFAGCFDQDGYTHDAECIIYRGPDSRYRGKEICFAYNEDTLTIVDVSVKSNPTMLSRVGYAGYAYTHQGACIGDCSILLLDDELDEEYGNTPDQRTKTYIWDARDLTKPTQIGSFLSSQSAIDHNQYVHGSFSFQANYCAGLRVLDVAAAHKGVLEEVAYFDVAPDCDKALFAGAWSNYLFPSGNVVVTSIERGVFMLKPHLDSQKLHGTQLSTPASHVEEVASPPLPASSASGQIAGIVALIAGIAVAATMLFAAIRSSLRMVRRNSYDTTADYIAA
jgi:choice-of-anchor B domain-containing protein